MIINALERMARSWGNKGGDTTKQNKNGRIREKMIGIYTRRSTNSYLKSKKEEEEETEREMKRKMEEGMKKEEKEKDMEEEKEKEEEEEEEEVRK